jgi:23S rRNA (cytidine1920-2'-O)/16S rRNA (cytidine1409-2'-O)-methyltransferase
VKKRIDLLLVERKMAGSREKAHAMVLAGDVSVGDEVVAKPATLVPDDAPIKLRQKPAFVSRGGTKLEHALEHFSIDVSGMVAMDVGASTGGFTDCLLKRGAARVYAVDVGYGQLDYRLRVDPKVTVMERVNARYLFALPEKVDLITMDVSFISLKKVIPTVAQLAKPGGSTVCLVKPQFEAGRSQVEKGGLVKDPGVHAQVLGDFISWVIEAGYRLCGLTPSPILGAAGNREFFVLLKACP